MPSDADARQVVCRARLSADTRRTLDRHTRARPPSFPEQMLWYLVVAKTLWLRLYHTEAPVSPPQPHLTIRGVGSSDSGRRVPHLGAPATFLGGVSP